MKYKVTIQAVDWKDNNDYPRTTDIYEQMVEELDIIGVIKATNKLV